MIPEGWTGGFSESNPDFAYPDVDLTSLEVFTNMANIDKLTRMQRVRHPEFSWQMVPGVPSTRVFTTFAKYISRLGYDDEGRVWSIICPQQGFGSAIGNLNFEVTVTGNRGWTDEPNRSTGVELSVTGQLWFNAKNKEDGNALFRLLMRFVKNLPDLPFSKSDAIQVSTNTPGDVNQQLFTVRDGMDPAYNAPFFKTHWNDGAYANVHLQAQIGAIIPRPGQSLIATRFNSLFIALLNFGSGNMLGFGNILSWNIWFDAPEIVDQKEWQNHAEKWRDSLNTNLTYPDQEGNQPDGGMMYFDGSNANPQRNARFILDQTEAIWKFIRGSFSTDEINAQVRSMHMDDSFSENDEEEILGQLRRYQLL
eukprot:CAMPEP_0194296078 /NCGR_PEP_ID=MMETSP0169-20130528/55129_1 /TAXON_ID=218684 /ORGANISM="Corethron pennatum, Strain L29A3" /LENGTH=364 /DNA_ID=CAMNT_0039045433 /DNA_START=275 /DNA_END=1369 /DNA_ORIENTATION=+